MVMIVTRTEVLNGRSFVVTASDSGYMIERDGYIGGVPSFTYNGTTYAPSWSSGIAVESETNGHAKITFAKKGELPVIFNGTKLQKIIFNGTEITSLIYNGTKLFFERLRGACDRVRPHPEGIKR